MSTWNDKPNDYEHACRIIKMLQSEITALTMAERLADGRPTIVATMAEREREAEQTPDRVVRARCHP